MKGVKYRDMSMGRTCWDLTLLDFRQFSLDLLCMPQVPSPTVNFDIEYAHPFQQLLMTWRVFKYTKVNIHRIDHRIIELFVLEGTLKISEF